VKLQLTNTVFHQFLSYNSDRCLNEDYKLFSLANTN